MSISKKIKLFVIYGGLITLVVAIIIFSIILFSPYKPEYEWYLEETDVYELWDQYSGEGITIAYLGSGLSKSYENAYKDRIVNPFNFILQNNNWYDTYGHGTAMITVSTGEFRNTGIYGIAPKANIMPIVVTDETGRTDGDTLALGISYAVENGANIINISLGSQLPNENVEEAVDYALENGIIVVAAVGDSNQNRILYPAKYNGVIGVQAQSKLGGKFLNANWGYEVDFMIPGEQIKSSNMEYKKFKISNGSSVSTAIMSGIIALMLEKDNNSSKLLNYLSRFNYENTFINFENMVNNYSEGDD